MSESCLHSKEPKLACGKCETMPEQQQQRHFACLVAAACSTRCSRSSSSSNRWLWRNRKSFRCCSGQNKSDAIKSNGPEMRSEEAKIFVIVGCSTCTTSERRRRRKVMAGALWGGGESWPMGHQRLAIYYLLLVFIVVCIVKTSGAVQWRKSFDSSSAAAIARKLEVFNNQHSPPKGKRANFHHQMNRTTTAAVMGPNPYQLSSGRMTSEPPTMAMTTYLPPSTSQTITINGNGNSSNYQASGHELRHQTNTKLDSSGGGGGGPTLEPRLPAPLPPKTTSQLPTVAARPQRANDRRWPSNRLIQASDSTAASAPVPFTATTQFDDEHDDRLYQLSANNHKTPPVVVVASSGSKTEAKTKINDSGSPNSLASSPASLIASRARALNLGAPEYNRRLDAGRSLVAIGSTDIKGHHEEPASSRLKAATNRRSVPIMAEEQPHAAANLASSSSSAANRIELLPDNSLRHLTSASEHSLLPQAPAVAAAVAAANLQRQHPSEPLTSDNVEDNVDGDDLSQYDDGRKTVMMMRLSSSSLSNLTNQKTINSSTSNSNNNSNNLSGAGNKWPNSLKSLLKPTQAAATTTATSTTISSDDNDNLKLQKHTNSNKVSKPSRQNLHRHLHRLSALLLNSDIRVTSELLVLNKSSPIDGLAAKNLTGRGAEVRQIAPNSVKALAVNNGKSMIWPPFEFFEDTTRESQEEGLAFQAPTHLNIYPAEGEEEEQASTLAAAAAVDDDDNDNDNDGSSLRLNWRGPIEQDATPLKRRDAEKPLEERTFYGPFTSGHNRLSLGSNLHEQAGPYNQRKKYGSNKQGSRHKPSNNNHSASLSSNPSIPSDGPNSNSTPKSISLKAAASMTGIRVTTDPKLASELVINSRGLITAPKRRLSHQTTSTTTTGTTDNNLKPTTTTTTTTTNKIKPSKGDKNLIRIISTSQKNNNSAYNRTKKPHPSLVQLEESDDPPDWLDSSSDFPIMRNIPTVVVASDKIWMRKNSSNKTFNQPTYELFQPDGTGLLTGGSGSGGGSGQDLMGSEEDVSPFLLDKVLKLNLSSGHDRHTGSPPNRIVIHDIAVRDDEANSIEAEHPDAPAKTSHHQRQPTIATAAAAAAAFGALDWPTGGHHSTFNNNSSSNNNTKASQLPSYFYHNPPYKHPHLPTMASVSKLSSHQENRTKSQSPSRPNSDNHHHHHYHHHPYRHHHNSKNQTTSQRHQQSYTHTLPSTSISAQDRNSSSLQQANSPALSANQLSHLQPEANKQQFNHSNAAGSSLPSIITTTGAPYETSAAMISMNSTLSPQLNALSSNSLPLPSSIQQQQQQVSFQATNQSSSAHNKPSTSVKLRNKLQHMIMDKILKNTQSIGNFTGSLSGSGTSPQPQWASLPTLASISQAATTMITPPPLLSSTVANNVASLLAQKLNFLVKPSFSSPFSSSARPPTQAQAHGGLGLGSLFSIRVGGQQPHSNHPSPSSAPPASASTTAAAHLAGNAAANKFKQRINPFISPAHTSVNRRTAGVGSLLISGFIYGLSVLPALMALTGINPLNPQDHTAASSSNIATTSRNRHNSPNNRRSPNSKKSKAEISQGARLPAAIGPSFATGPYAYLVPMISTMATEPAAAASSSPSANHEHPSLAQQTAIRSLYAPPPTIIGPHVIADSHPTLDEFGSYNTDGSSLHSQSHTFKGLIGHHHHHHQGHRIYQPAQALVTPSSLQLASSMQLINEQLDPIYARYKDSTAHLRYSQSLAPSSSSPNDLHWPPLAERADEFGEENMGDDDDDDDNNNNNGNNYNYQSLWNHQEEPANESHQRSKGNFDNYLDPISAGGSQQHLTVQRASKNPLIGQGNSSVIMMKPISNYRAGFKLLKASNRIQARPAPTKPKLIEFKSVKDVSNYGSMDQWRAIPAPAIKDRKKYNLNQGYNQRRADKGQLMELRRN